MILRRATPDDLPALARLHRRTVRTSLPFLPELHTPDEDARFFAEVLSARNAIWLAEHDGAAIGYVAFRADWIDHLFVDPDHQGAGIGDALLALALREPAQVRLWTFQRNQRARRFYERRGFRLVLLTDGADNEEKEPDALYEWRRPDPAPI